MRALDPKRLAISISLLVVALSATVAHGDVIYKLTFDDDGEIGAPANESYTPAKGDVVAKTASIDRIDGKDNPKTLPKIVKSDGFQGGKAIELVRPADGSNSGYITRSQENHVVPISGGITVETVVFLSGYDPGPSDGLAGLVSTWGVGGLGPQLRLERGGENNPCVTWSITWHNQSIKYEPPTPIVGAWHHIAGVYTRTAGQDAEGKTISKIELFVDGKSVGQKTYPFNDYQVFVSGGFTFGVDAPNHYQGRVMYGKLDAVVVSDDVRTPATFLLPVSAAAATTAPAAK